MQGHSMSKYNLAAFKGMHTPLRSSNIFNRYSTHSSATALRKATLEAKCENLQ